LLITGRLFGTLIQHQLVSSITLGIALRYVLEALRKDPDQAQGAGGSNQKMFQFGKAALEQFHTRLGEWPQYCSNLTQIPHFARCCPDISAEATRIATGSAPAVPPIPGLDTVPYFTNETVFENAEPIPHLIIIGGGVSAKHEKFFSHLRTRAHIVPAQMGNAAGIVGAALSGAEK
jgi:hypothetical protein